MSVCLSECLSTVWLAGWLSCHDLVLTLVGGRCGGCHRSEVSKQQVLVENRARSRDTDVYVAISATPFRYIIIYTHIFQIHNDMHPISFRDIITYTHSFQIHNYVHPQLSDTQLNTPTAFKYIITYTHSFQIHNYTPIPFRCIIAYTHTLQIHDYTHTFHIHNYIHPYLPDT